MDTAEMPVAGEVSPPLRDYSLNRKNSDSAIALGLAEAEWYQCAVARAEAFINARFGLFAAQLHESSLEEVDRTELTAGLERHFRREQHELFTPRDRDMIVAARRHLARSNRRPNGASDDAYYRVRHTDDGHEGASANAAGCNTADQRADIHRGITGGRNTDHAEKLTTKTTTDNPCDGIPEGTEV